MKPQSAGIPGLLMQAFEVSEFEPVDVRITFEAIVIPVADSTQAKSEFLWAYSYGDKLVTSQPGPYIGVTGSTSPDSSTHGSEQSDLKLEAGSIVRQTNQDRPRKRYLQQIVFEEERCDAEGDSRILLYPPLPERVHPPPTDLVQDLPLWLLANRPNRSSSKRRYL
ncbi:hypothetical protein R1sor_023528 [Riccia sorocarpa]|uniref:Uncharacterized protein n=1 Tax=Riccia sorocarpa TaxID=122646 RepID=A0ABD3GQW4_9MARC